MPDRPVAPDRRRRRLVIALGIVAGVLWVVGVGLGVAVLVVIGSLPGHDPARTSRALVIAAGAFTTFAIPAALVTVGFSVVRRARGQGRDT